MRIIFATGNPGKVETAQKVLGKFGVELEQQEIDIPEIQDVDVGEVAKFSVKYAAEKIGQPVFVTDVGLCINSLNGFPGSFLKFLNKWFIPEDILRLMSGVKDRTAVARECLAYCEPGKEPLLFFDEKQCRIALEAEGEGSTIDKLLIWPGFDRVQGLIPREEMTAYWAENNEIYRKFGEYISK
jgi:XTP/dITP diphosphohydrolase